MSKQTSDSAQKGPGLGPVTSPGKIKTVHVPVSGVKMPQPPVQKG